MNLFNLNIQFKNLKPVLIAIGVACGLINSAAAQPVVPVKLNTDWNYIPRPVITLDFCIF